MSRQWSVLIVEDEARVAATMSAALQREGFEAEAVSSLEEGLLRLPQKSWRIALVDLGLPDGSGLHFVRKAASRPGLGVIIVTGRGEETERVVGLEVGADDYMTKPFSMRELIARVRALQRRLDAQDQARAAAAATPAPAPRTWRLAGVLLDPARLRLVGQDGREQRLTGAEGGLLSLLLEAADQGVERTVIAERVLGHRLLPQQRGIDQLASSLRHKLDEASAGRIRIVALRGRGYRLVWPD
ncbi:response regulator transcription factor [Crenalkalicoccus roseus]|uniref:response regulator transcription factor n=1 Tax=Crenalkalicoccus roseus TaxID=1485588 RepID=UPI0010803139|nr:response regulator transcription factor [Crenalkalicoccus roseus]